VLVGKSVQCGYLIVDVKEGRKEGRLSRRYGSDNV
jgi:hypothetical protein